MVLGALQLLFLVFLSTIFTFKKNQISKIKYSIKNQLSKNSNFKRINFNKHLSCAFQSEQKSKKEPFMENFSI